ncbi:PrpR N-terminal domain-containing protein [Aquibacillus albus]|uniref:DNA-binding NtrC family response regulator n=1 Tax=Aquibacillus albus TaxID=1168171 RepID=A0ABS2MW82_9BACI|nr:sigma-54-dependent transcriptional regulator [Aquibacillus albus]MBM7570146.1 DNA-binding NtrC family response regulator [Aquibacillus albus]
MIKALLIAPYSGLAETAKKMTHPKDIKLDIVIGNLEEGVKIARSAEKQGYELIISRGGTASMIQEAVSIPVVHIDITGYDMLRVFTLLRGFENGVALVGYANISEGANTLCNILEYDVKMITINSSEEVRGYLEKLKEENYSVVIGDVITVQVAEEVGLRGVLITSGKEAVMDAFEEGRRVYQYFRKVNHQFDYLRNAFIHTPLPIVLLDKNQKIVEKNLKFEQEIGNDTFLKSSIVSQITNKVLNNGTHWTKIEDEEHSYEVQAFIVNKREHMVGFIIHSSLIHSQNKSMTMIDHVNHVPFIGDSNFARRLRENINQYVQADEPICIVGEPGTGKRTISKLIHFQRYGHDAPMIVVEGKQVTNADIEKIGRKLHRMDKGSLVLRNMETLSVAMQSSIHELIQMNDHIKVIVLGNRTLEELVNQANFSEELYQKISQYPLHIPPLRERKEDIKPFVDYFIAEFHTNEGNETLGIKQEAVEYMFDYKWEYNLSQLKQVVRELTLLSDRNYIELSQVKELLSQYMQEDNDKQDRKALSLQGTLKEIEQQIIHLVLQEEDHNQSKAASRLGINRSTLWRKLKS